MLIWNSTMDNIGRDNFILVLCMENAIVSCYVLCRAIVDFVFTRRLPKVFISSEWVQIWHIVWGVLYYAVLSPWFVLIFFSILLYDRSQSYFCTSTAFCTWVPFSSCVFLFICSFFSFSFRYSNLYWALYTHVFFVHFILMFGIQADKGFEVPS